MNRYLMENLFRIKGLNNAWYGVIIACGMLLGTEFATCQARNTGMNSGLIYDFLLVAVPIAIICARAYYVIFEWSPGFKCRKR